MWWCNEMGQTWASQHEKVQGSLQMMKTGLQGALEGADPGSLVGGSEGGFTSELGLALVSDLTQTSPLTYRLPACTSDNTEAPFQAFACSAGITSLPVGKTFMKRNDLMCGNNFDSFLTTSSVLT